MRLLRGHKFKILFASQVFEGVARGRHFTFIAFGGVGGAISWQQMELPDGDFPWCWRCHSLREDMACRTPNLKGQEASRMPDKPLFYGLSYAQLSGLYQFFTHLFI
ncbi:uncharacterized protein DS421_15g503940 [Arachis hypogaea]|nr:uncharacterized protein DS421_15g503940 [Arachis hypogaea]